MAIRNSFPQAVFSKTFTDTANATYTTTIPQFDFDSLTFKFVSSTINALAGNAVLSVYIQTTDDGGTTFYDLGRFIDVPNTASVMTNANAWFLNVPVNVGSALYIGTAAAKTLGVGSISGMPLLSNTLRIQYAWSASASSTSWALTAYANNVSAGVH